MKKKVLAWIAAIAIVALVSAAFLRPADANPDFGLVARVYAPDDVIALENLEGDVDLLRPLSGAPSHYGIFGRLEVKFDAACDIAFTRRHYVDGERVSGADEDDIGFVERWENGEWVYHNRLYTTYIYLQVLFHETYYIDTLPAHTDYPYGVPLSFDLTQPGHYRLTYYFRELLADNGDPYDSDFTTGEEQYSVSHTITVPEPSGKPFDLLTVHIDEVNDGFSTEYTNVRFAIRSNLAAQNAEHNDVPTWKRHVHDYIGDLYFDRAATRLEKRLGFGWVEAPAREGQPSAVESLIPEDADYRYNVGVDFDNSILDSYVRLYTPDDARYRLTLEFVENADGSGERYVLTLNLDLSEEEKQ